MRIASLLPSATEIVCALGAEADLVAISHECDFPPSIRSLPRLTRPLIDPEAASAVIHRSVAERAQKGLSLYEVDREALQALKPDVILTQDQCEVCAVSLAEVEAALREIAGPATRLGSLRPLDLKGVSESFLQVGILTDRFKESVRLAKVFWDRLHALKKAAGPDRPRVLCLEWVDPFMIAGHWTPELVRLAGGEPLIVTEPGPFQTVDPAQCLAAQPDLMVVMPCGFSLERTEQEMRSRASFWNELASALPCGLFLTDGNQFFNRSGPRLVESAEILAAIMEKGEGPHFRRWNTAE